MSRLLIVSNRLPVTVKVDHNHFSVAASTGGLATGLSGPHERSGGLWIGWPGETSRLATGQRLELDAELAARRCVPLHLSSSESSRYYEGFSNGVLWPLFHYLSDRVPLHSRDWKAYARVNQRFADLVAEHYQPGDQIWVHDYQLCLVPGLLRQRLPEARIGFFLHIPFPSGEMYRILPWREELLHGLLGADLIGFHTLAYMSHFSNVLLHQLGLTPDLDRVPYAGREVRLGAFPMGVDTRAWADLAGSPDVLESAAGLRGDGSGERLILAIDRLDYTKGIRRRLLAVERLLEREPSLRGKVRLIQVAVPSRTVIDQYAAFRQQVDQLVGRINGAYATLSSVPIHYLFRSFTQRQLAAMYRAADVMMVTPLRDGMNLVAKEFVACRTDEDGVLMLSEFAGAASELGEALLVNPYDVDGVASALKRALEMPAEERRTRLRALRRRVFQSDVHHWAGSFLEELARCGAAAPDAIRLSSRQELEGLVQRVRGADRLLLLLDYDGTLVPFARRPELAAPDADLTGLLVALTARPNTSVQLVSARSQEVLERWFGTLPMGLHAENGLWSRARPGEPWVLNRELDLAWKPRVREVFEQFVFRAPGSFIEEKTASLAWHYRMADPEFGERQAKELQYHLTQTLSNVPVEVVHGHRVVEVQPHGVRRALVAERGLAVAHPGTLVVAIGDDPSDEELFAALPSGSVAIRVGPMPSRAPYRLADAAAVRAFLLGLAERR